MMKKAFLIAFATTLFICELFSIVTPNFSRAEDPLNSAKAPIAVAVTSYSDWRMPMHDAVVRLPNGTLCATFCGNRQPVNYNDVVYVVSSSDDGATWGAPTKVSGTTKTGNNTEPNQGTFGPVIATDANNNVFVAWSGVSETSAWWQVWCTIYDGSKWSEPTQVSRDLDTGLTTAFVDIAVDGNNNVHLVWDSSINGNETYDYEQSRIFYAKYDGTWSKPIVISKWPDATKNRNFTPCIAVDSQNNLHVVWAETNYLATEGKIWYTKYNGAWQAPAEIATSSVPDIYGTYLEAPSIAIDSNNNIHVLWHGAYDNNVRVNQIWYMKYTTSWSTPITISNVPLMNSSDQENPSIAIDSYNNVHVLWMSKRESVLFYSRYDSSWIAPVQIEDYRSTYPSFRWSTFPASKAVGSKLDYIFFRGSTLMFNSLPTSEVPSGPTFSASVTPISEFIGIGQSLQLTSTVIAGNPPYSYQWYLNDSEVAGATSNLWIFKSATVGTYTVRVTVTDAVNNKAQSEPAQVKVTQQYLKGSFGYSSLASEAGGENPYAAFGSRFTLNVEANITSMSALMSTWSGPRYASTYNYRFAIYTDNNNAIGTLIGQTAQATAKAGFKLFNTASFPLPVYLQPGAYWLMGVADFSPSTDIYGPETNDYNVSMTCDIGSMTFPSSLPQTQPRLGHLYCIYASWELNQSGIVDQERNLFTAISNSTVSSLAYDPTKKELSFTVTGPPNTTGYTEIFISKTILPEPTGLTVLLDGKHINYTVTSAEDFWALHFEYSHSTHNVAINMQSYFIPEFYIIITIVFIVLTLTALSLVFLLRKKRLKQTKTQKQNNAAASNVIFGFGFLH
jgi:hypothetical protein